jgi:hypothetical protein
MTPQAFKNSWTDATHPLLPFSRARLKEFELMDETTEYLRIAGLPGCAEPDLNFLNDADDIDQGICRLTELFNLEDEPEFDIFVVIGSCRDGDVIAIDTNDNAKILQLDHEDGFSGKYFNNSIVSLTEFLILYRTFQEEVLARTSRRHSYDIWNFTDEQFDQLKNSMYLSDSKAITEDGFWKDELDMMLMFRNEKFSIK